ncbi:MAG: TetR/AcrR family transcriptional regulator [Bdellovibrionaceae bacterium]|nr:TetR/AcrR family transcriptional regulator [Pseudobdellovibrionaceae bacterium]
MSETLTRKQRTREKILDSALKLFRKSGIDGTGIDSVMKKSGLTAGGFYAHFKSKENLIIEVLDTALNQAAGRLKAAALETPADPARGLLDLYLSAKHRDNPASGCALVALSTDLARRSPAVAEKIGGYLERWIGFFMRNGYTRTQAVQQVALAVGTLTLARMLKGQDLSDEFLKAGVDSSQLLRKPSS